MVKGSNQILLASRLTRHKRLFTLLHEAGHALSYKLGFNVECYKVLGSRYQAGNRENERLACVLGASIAFYLGIYLPWKDWIEFNWEAKLR